jgi:hypothetical protein
MPTNVQLDHALQLVIATVSGAFNADEMVYLVTRARTEAANHHYPILYDMSAASPKGIGLADIFWMPRNVSVLKEEGAGRRKIAALYPAGQQEMARFWETTFRNSGLQVQAFTDRETALAWLAEK